MHGVMPRYRPCAFKRRLTVEFEDPPERFEKITVPRLILHPLLENAFEHGLNNVEKDGILRVWYERRRGKAVYSCTGQRHRYDAAGTGTVAGELPAVRGAD